MRPGKLPVPLIRPAIHETHKLASWITSEPHGDQVSHARDDRRDLVGVFSARGEHQKAAGARLDQMCHLAWFALPRLRCIDRHLIGFNSLGPVPLRLLRRRWRVEEIQLPPCEVLAVVVQVDQSRVVVVVCVDLVHVAVPVFIMNAARRPVFVTHQPRNERGSGKIEVGQPKPLHDRHSDAVDRVAVEVVLLIREHDRIWSTVDINQSISISNKARAQIHDRRPRCVGPDGDSTLSQRDEPLGLVVGHELIHKDAFACGRMAPVHPTLRWGLRTLNRPLYPSTRVVRGRRNGPSGTGLDDGEHSEHDSDHHSFRFRLAGWLSSSSASSASSAAPPSNSPSSSSSSSSIPAAPGADRAITWVANEAEVSPDGDTAEGR
mmetsp:Transcript_7402/g.23329  ORF Transcript_7402/g.23329 Transcript_7402/m.23329 type:complete len:377 (+) Transcript_7402:91-1221(+)